MEYVKTFTNCGCQIVISGELHDAQIHYCPKHKAAFDMYEALKHVAEKGLDFSVITTGSDLSIWRSHITTNYSLTEITKALAKAEGKQE